MKYLSFSLAIITFIIGIGIGYTLTPQYSLAETAMASNSFGRADRYVDRRYINAMIVHHRGAMLMAEQVKDTTNREDVRNMVHDILKNEPVAIDQLYAWKRDWYNDATEVSDPLVPKFGSYDDTFDLRFMNALVAHHFDGIDMANDIMMKSSRNEILKNADGVKTYLVTTLAALRDWRTQWYGVN